MIGEIELYFIKTFPGTQEYNTALYRLDAWDKCSGLVHWEDPEGSGREGGGRGDQDGEYMQIHGWFTSMYDKNHYNIVKYLASN